MGIFYGSKPEPKPDMQSSENPEPRTPPEEQYRVPTYAPPAPAPDRQFPPLTKAELDWALGNE